MFDRTISHTTSAQDPIELYPERANLFPLSIKPRPTQLYLVREKRGTKVREHLRFTPTSGAEAIDVDLRRLRWALQDAILEAISSAGYRVDRKGTRPTVVDTACNLANQPTLRIYPAYELQVVEFGSSRFLCLDHHLRVHAANLSLARLIERAESFRPLPDQRVLVRRPEGWAEASLVKIRDDGCELVTSSGEMNIASPQHIFPDLTRDQILQLAPVLAVQPDELERAIKRLPFLTVANASRARLDACAEFADRLASDVFPIEDNCITITLRPVPARLRPPVFQLGKDLVEPAVSFDRIDATKRGQDILSGLTTFGAYDTPTTPLRLALLAPKHRIVAMERLVDRMNVGSVRYGGAERTFGGRFVVAERLICPSINDYADQIRDFSQDPRAEQVDVALVYLPKGSDTRNPSHPYYRTKAVMLREGFASQMVDEVTVRNPDWRDLNLALNVYAKAGYAPWVLDEAVPSVDLFIGLSSSSVGAGSSADRIMAYANVFDTYGRWRFYRGDATAFPFAERVSHFERLARDSVAAYRAENGGPLSSVHFHLTMQPSMKVRQVLAQAVRAVAPGASVTIIWVNPHHVLRLYDLSEGSGGEISRATYLLQEPGRIFVTTTGRNQFGQRGMGTPVPLQLTAWVDRGDVRASLPEIAQQVLSLTRLNWASSRSFCHEPITTKYAGDIAKGMAIFARDPRFAVHPRLRRVPWFL